MVGVPQFENRAIYNTLQSTSSRAEAKNEGRHTSALLVRLRGGENCIFTLLPLQNSASLIETFILLSSVTNTDTENIFLETLFTALLHVSADVKYILPHQA